MAYSQTQYDWIYGNSGFVVSELVVESSEQDNTSSTYIAFRTCVVSVTTRKEKKLHALPTFKISITIS